MTHLGHPDAEVEEHQSVERVLLQPQPTEAVHRVGPLTTAWLVGGVPAPYDSEVRLAGDRHPGQEGHQGDLYDKCWTYGGLSDITS